MTIAVSQYFIVFQMYGIPFIAFACQSEKTVSMGLSQGTKGAATGENWIQSDKKFTMGHYGKDIKSVNKIQIRANAPALNAHTL